MDKLKGIGCKSAMLSKLRADLRMLQGTGRSMGSSPDSGKSERFPGSTGKEKAPFDDKDNTQDR